MRNKPVYSQIYEPKINIKPSGNTPLNNNWKRDVWIGEISAGSIQKVQIQNTIQKKYLKPVQYNPKLKITKSSQGAETQIKISQC